MLKPFLPLLLGLAAVTLVTAFALMNRTPVALWLLGWRWWLPLVWVILGSFAAGVGVGVGLSLRRQFYLARRLSDLRLEASATALEPQFAPGLASAPAVAAGVPVGAVVVAEAASPATAASVPATEPPREVLVTLHE